MSDDLVDLFTRAGKLMRAVGAAELKPHGLYLGQNLVLGLLWDRDGRTPGELAAALGVTTPTVVKMASRMASAGLLVRRRDERDNRLVRLHLTDAGRVLREPVAAMHDRLHDALAAPLTEAERHHLATALRKIITSLETLHPEPIDHTADS